VQEENSMVKNVNDSMSALKHIGGAEVQLHSFLTLAIGGGEWSASHSVCFIPRETTPVAIQQQLIWKFREQFFVPAGI
jgi:hypothetical protein